MGQLQDKYKSYRDPQKFMDAGVYPYFRRLQVSKEQRLQTLMAIRF